MNHSSDNPFEKMLIEAHKFSRNNMPSLSRDKRCGCFYCSTVFDPEEIEEYLESDSGIDEYGTAICPYCGIDSVIPESAGYPLTKEFLDQMYREWFDSGIGVALYTPFGEVKLLLDGKEVCCEHQSIDIKPKCSDVDGCHYITFDFSPDGKKHSLKFIKDNVESEGEIEPGELLEAITFEEKNGQITLGCKASFGDFEDYGLDYDGSYIDNGIELEINSKTHKQTFEFAVAWIENTRGKNPTQTWLAADPFGLKQLI